MSDLPATPPNAQKWAKRPSREIAVRTGRQLREGASRAPALLRAGGAALGRLRSSESGGVGAKIFIAMVVLPTLVYFLYAALWQTRSYVAETRLSVRAAQEQRAAIPDASSILGKLTGGAKSGGVQDSYIVLNYIKSSAIVSDLGGQAYFEKNFGGSNIDYLSRLPAQSTIEDVLKYWLRRVTATVDTVSGILVVKIEAYRAEDASRVAEDVVRLSEALINNITIRNRRDAVERAEREVGLAAAKLATARDALTAFREKNVLIDPAARAQSIGELVAKLTMEKISIENSLATLKGVVNDDAPTQRIQRTKLAAIDQQIAELKRGLTDSRNDAAVAAQVASYERLKLEEQFTERVYGVAQSSYLRARQELEKQQLYLAVVVPPRTPEQATYPRVFAGTLLLFASLFALWGVGSLFAASVNDQMI